MSQLMQRFDDQAEGLEHRGKDRKSMEILLNRVKGLESALQANPSGRKPKKPLLNMDLDDDGVHDPPQPSRFFLSRDQQEAMIRDLKDEILEWAQKELPGAAYSQVNLGKGGRKKLKAELRDEILDLILVPVSNRAMDAIAHQVIKKTEEAIEYRLARETVERRREFEGFTSSLKDSIQALVEESIQSGATLAELVEQVKVAQKVVVDARSTEKILVRVQAAQDELKKAMNEVKGLKEEMKDLVKESKREVKEIKGDVKNQIKWAKEEAERLEEKATEMRVSLASAVEEGEKGIRGMLAEFEEGSFGFGCAGSAAEQHPAFIDDDHDHQSDQLNRTVKNDLAMVQESSGHVRGNQPPMSPMDIDVLAIQSSNLDNLQFANKAAAITPALSPFDQIRALLDQLEMQHRAHATPSSSGEELTALIAPPSTPVATLTATSDVRLQPEIFEPIPRVPAMQAHIHAAQSGRMPSGMPSPLFMLPTAPSMSDMEAGWILSPSSQVSTTSSDMEAELARIPLEAVKDGEKVRDPHSDPHIRGEEGEKVRREADNTAVQSWPEEWPMYWEGGDPTGLGRARDDRDMPAADEKAEYFEQ